MNAANDNAPATRAAERAKYEADMVAWHARQARAKAYWAAHPYRPLGEITWPVPEVKQSYKRAYYKGGHRMVIDGVPIRVAAHVKTWSARARACLGKGTAGWKEQQELDRQARALGLVTPEISAHDLQLYESRERPEAAA